MKYDEEYIDNWYSYLIKLYKEYCFITNKKSTLNLNLTNLLDDKKFLSWCISIHKKTIIYKQFLHAMDVPLDKETTIEVNKGFFDTLGKDLVSIVSLHAMTLELPKSHLLTGNNKPVILCNGKLYYPSNCSLFLTHNDLETAKQLLTLHNNGYNILIGAYGGIEERYLWFKMLEELKRENDSLKFECDSLNDDYYAFITSTHKTKRKILTR